VKLFDEGRAAAFGAAARNERCAQCHFWGAINLALYGQTVGVLKTLSSLGEVKEHLRRSLELDPAYASGGAYRLLGLIEQRLPGILGGNNDRARELFTKAVEVAPDEPLNYLFLARLERDELRHPAESIRYVRLGLSVPTPAGERLESLESLAELRQMSAQLR
jgi:tetratricopeptide (TPR) repeat protein